MKSKYCAVLDINGEIFFLSSIQWDREVDKHDTLRIYPGIFTHHFIISKSFKSAKKWNSRQAALDSLTYYNTHDYYEKFDVRKQGKVIFENNTDIFNDIFDEAIDFYSKNPRYKTKVSMEKINVIHKKTLIEERKRKCTIKTDVKIRIEFTNERKLKLEKINEKGSN